jgi:hypothetical protein
MERAIRDVFFCFLLIITSAHTNNHAEVYRQFIRNFVSIYMPNHLFRDWNVKCVRRTCPVYKHTLWRTNGVHLFTYRLVIVQSSQIWTKQVHTKKVYLHGTFAHLYFQNWRTFTYIHLSIALTILYRRQPSVNY